MAYETYTTEAIVCGRSGRSEHDCTLRLYTKEAGMIYARAGGIRAHQSKLRYALQDFSYSTVSLVHGRYEWRVVGAVAKDNFYYAARSRASRKSLLSAMRFIRRLMRGGGAQQQHELFALVLDGLELLTRKETEGTHEALFYLRVLHRLGYVAPHKEYVSMVHAETLEEAYALCSEEMAFKKYVKRVVEEALAVSQL